MSSSLSSNTEAEAPYSYKIGAPPPFSLGGIIITSTLFSVFAGGILTALNWNRLGKPLRFLPTLAGAFVLAVVIAAMGAAAVPLFFPSMASDSIFALLVALPLNFAAGVLLARWQRADYLRWSIAHQGQRPTLSQSGCGAFALIVVLSFVIGSCVMPFFAVRLMSSFLSLRPTQTFQGDNVTLVYPGSYYPTDANTSQLCQNAKCLFAAGRSSEDVS